MAAGRGSSGVGTPPRRHPVGGPVADEPNQTGLRRGRRWVLLLLALGALFVGLRGIHGLADQPQQSAIFTDRGGRRRRDRSDRTDAGGSCCAGHSSRRCANRHGLHPSPLCRGLRRGRLDHTRSWSGAAVGGLCAPKVQNGKVTDWAARQAAAAARRGDAQLGTSPVPSPDVLLRSVLEQLSRPPNRMAA